jgi:hypothetical protein
MHCAVPAAEGLHGSFFSKVHLKPASCIRTLLTAFPFVAIRLREKNVLGCVMAGLF